MTYHEAESKVLPNGQAVAASTVVAQSLKKPSKHHLDVRVKRAAANEKDDTDHSTRPNNLPHGAPRRAETHNAERVHELLPQSLLVSRHARTLDAGTGIKTQQTPRPWHRADICELFMHARGTYTLVWYVYGVHA